MNSEPDQSVQLPPPDFLVASFKKYKTHRCEKCGIGFREVAELRKHQFVDDRDCEICPCCNQYFSSAKGMKQHFGKIHSKYRPSRCVTCKKRFRNKYALKFHVKQVHEQSTRESCPHCHVEMYNSYSVKRHLFVCRAMRNETK